MIDSLLIELRLDPSNFDKGQKAAIGAFNKAKEAAEKDAKAIEASARHAADAISSIADAALTLFAVFTGGRAIKDFIEQTTNANAALARLSQNIGVAPDNLSAWEKAVERAGGSAEGAASSFQSLSDAIQAIKTGDTHIVPILARLQGLGGTRIDFINGTPDQVFAAVSKDLQAIARSNPALAHSLGRQLPIDEGTLNFLLQRNVGAELSRSRDLGVLTPEQVKNLQDLQDKWIAFQQKMGILFERLAADAAPFIAAVLNFLTALAQHHPRIAELAAAALTAVVALTSLTAAIRALALVAGALGVAPRAAGVATALGAGAAVAVGAGIAALLVETDPLGTVARTRRDNIALRLARQRGHARYTQQDIDDADRIARGGAGAAPASGAAGVSPDTILNTLDAAQRQQLLGGMVGQEAAGAASTNPGNLRYSAWAARHGAIGANARGFAIFPDRATGMAAMEALVFGTYGNRSIQGMLAGDPSRHIPGYAPAADNNDPVGYARRIAGRVSPSRAGAVTYLPSVGAPAAAAIRHSTTSNQSSSTSSSQTTVGTVNIHTQAKDANGIARDFAGALRRNDLATQSNYGLA